MTPDVMDRIIAGVMPPAFAFLTFMSVDDAQQRNEARNKLRREQRQAKRDKGLSTDVARGWCTSA